ncbi:hypothetical protein [Butyrivibrio sp. AE3004]|uniref:hypothetical protein n=1 Tax=Butyrivibrio sp. AE3004 TaxID=1506994 RepID=UPI0004943D45|nr:hypothetical protein [Butyrivibrio sp. AE3004]
MSKLLKNGIVLVAGLAMMLSLVLSPVKAYAAGQTGDTTVEKASDAEISQIMTYTESLLKESFGNNYKITREGDLVTISIWQNGMAEFAALAIEDKNYKAGWDDMMNTLKEMADAVNGLYRLYNLNCAVNLLNELNTDNALASYYNGMLVYDATSNQ